MSALLHLDRELSSAQVTEIRERDAAGEGQVTLAGEFGASPAQISHIVTGQTWKHVRGPVRPVKGKTKLSAEQVLEIRRRVSEGESQTSVAAAFGVNQSHVSGLTSGRKRFNRAGGLTTPRT